MFLLPFVYILVRIFRIKQPGKLGLLQALRKFALEVFHKKPFNPFWSIFYLRVGEDGQKMALRTARQMRKKSQVLYQEKDDC